MSVTPSARRRITGRDIATSTSDWPDRTFLRPTCITIPRSRIRIAALPLLTLAGALSRAWFGDLAGRRESDRPWSPQLRALDHDHREEHEYASEYLKGRHSISEQDDGEPDSDDGLPRA